MRISKITAAALTTIIAVFADGASAGLAFCEYRASKDAEPVYRILIDPLKDSVTLDSQLRRQIKQELGNRLPSCHRLVQSRYEAGTWQYKVGEIHRKDYEGNMKRVFGIGFGKTGEETTQNLVKHLGTRDWGWSRKRHGFKVVESGNFKEPDKDSACYQMVRYRDRQLIKQVDKEFKILARVERSEKLLTDLEEEFSDMDSKAGVIRLMDRSIRVLDTTAKFVSSYVPPGADISHAAGTLSGKLINAYKQYGNTKKFLGVLKGEVLSFAKIAASLVAKKSTPVGYALKVKVGNIQAAKSIVEAAENDREWQASIDTVNQSLAGVRQELSKLRQLSEASSERLAVINETKNFIDQTCNTVNQTATPLAWNQHSSEKDLSI